MPITQALNSKANIKKKSNQDLPFSPQQPVLDSYYAVSTASQTVINLTFSVDQANKDQFFLFVDGKKLREGASNDYQFTAIDTNNTSSQVTLNYSIIANLNIQAHKLGLKKESEFLMDNRFVQLYDAQNEGFQAFIKSSNVLIAVNGTPSAGQFRSSVTNRASIPDLSNDLSVNMAVNRFPIQQIYPLQNEFGPNGEIVWAPINDKFNQVRFIGSGWTNRNDSTGPCVSGEVDNDYIEITFYGTGLNTFLSQDSASGSDIRATVDGGVESSNLMLNMSTILQQRGYPANNMVPISSGLSLGLHTIKLRFVNTNSVVRARTYGFEVLNESSNVKVNPGTAYIAGKQIINSALSSSAYNSGFTNVYGSAGTKGGRVLVYSDGQGNIKKDVQYVNTSIQTLSSTDHSNEEVARVYSTLEFGSNRGDDFNSNVIPNVARAFTLDDGTTMLSSTITSGGFGSSADGFSFAEANGHYMVFTFVGTGLDLELRDNGNGGADTYNFQIDGGSTIAWPYTAGSTTPRTIKLVSGLPYGTHTIKFNRVSAGTFSILARKFIVYQPKKPALPSGAVELADYNIIGDYDGSTATSTSDFSQVPVGTINKNSAREFIYNGSWSANGVQTWPGGWSFYSGTNGDSIKYTFFGTGINFMFNTSGAGNTDFTADFNGSLNSSGVARGNMTNLGSGSYRITQTASSPSRVEFTGLSLGVYTVTLTKTAGGGALELINAWLITPIHSVKSNLFADIQNTLPVGSQGISDNRQFTALKEKVAQKKNWAQAFGIVSNPSNSSSSLLPIPDMSCAIETSGGDLLLNFNAIFANGVNGANIQFYVDGSPVGIQMSSGDYNDYVNMELRIPVSIGRHKVDVYWGATGVAASIYLNKRTLLVQEV